MQPTTEFKPKPFFQVVVISKKKFFQSNHSFVKFVLFCLQILELTDALAVNSTAVRLEWHLLLSNTDDYIEVIQWNNLIELAEKSKLT